MKEWLALAGLGTGLFVAALFGTLAVQGRLDRDGTRGIPVVSWLFDAPEDGSEPASSDEAFSAADQTPAAARRRPTEPPSQAPDTAPTEVPIDGLFDFPKLDGGMTAEDLERVLHAARDAEAEARRERARVEAMEADVLARQRDLEDRESAIARRMLQVDQERERLERRIAEFEQKVLLVEKDELRGLREYGRTLGAFDPARAAKIVLEEWQTDEGRKRITKVLAVMDPTEVDAVLAGIEDARIREVLLERLKIAFEPRDR